MNLSRSTFSLCLVAVLASDAFAQKVVVVHNSQFPIVAPFNVDFAPHGTYFVEMAKGERLRMFNGTTAVTVAGTGQKGPMVPKVACLNATFNGMHSLAVGPEGVVFVADTWNHCIRTFSRETDEMILFAGTGKKGFSGDGGPAMNAQFGGVYSLAFNPKRDKLVIADLDNRRIRMIDMKTTVVSTVAGNGEKGIPKDGDVATSSPLLDPRAAALDSRGQVYLLERNGHVLRLVDPKGKITTVAGTGKAGAAGLGGLALKAGMNGPKHLWVDADDTVLIADTENHRIVRYDPATKLLTLVAGSGKRGSGGVGGPPEKVELNQPHGVSVHPTTKQIYIADSTNNRILRIEP